MEKSASDDDTAGQSGSTGSDIGKELDTSAYLRADNPIRRPEEDLLGRSSSAKSLAEHLLRLDASEGLVVGVLGPWGSGKTSFINLVHARLKEIGIPALSFNPWMFSGAEQLVDSFFIEVSAQLKLKASLRDIGDKFQEYGRVFSPLKAIPLIGSYLEGIASLAEAIGKFIEWQEGGVAERRKRVEEALRSLRTPIVVTLDDIDRLTTAEIRDVFRLVRLTANFPNVIYLLAFDRERVEGALSEQGLPGRAYLEKILQLADDLPTIPAQVLDTQLFDALNETLSMIDKTGPFDRDTWHDHYSAIIRPLLRNMRDVRRYVAAVPRTVSELDGHVELADVLALEAIRVFLPDVFSKLASSVAGLTATSSFRGYDEPALKHQVESLVSASATHADVARALVERLFPAAQRHLGGSSFGPDWTGRWLRNRRVAHASILHFYLEHVPGAELNSLNLAEHAWSLMSDSHALEEYLSSIEPNRRQSAVSTLESFEDDYQAEHVIPTATVLLNLLPGLPVQERGLFEPDSRTVVRRVVLRLLRALKDGEAIESAVLSILADVRTLGSRNELITLVGYQENVGHKLVSEEFAASIERELRDQVRAASPAILAQERGVIGLLTYVRRQSDDPEPLFEVPDSTDLDLALLKSARSDSVLYTSGSRAPTLSPRLAWEALIDLYGNEDTLLARIASLASAGVEQEDELLDLAAKYAEGWRPKDFADD